MSFTHRSVQVLENAALATRTYRIRLQAPELAQTIRPGQFLMIRLPGTSDPLLGRPYALYDTVLDEAEQPTGVDVVYLVVGKQTGRLAELRAGDRLEVWGPLGNGFPDLSGIEHVGLVAGGISQTPFLAYIRELLGERGYGGQPARQQALRVSVHYGVRTADLAAGVADMREAGAKVYLATDDGSLGFHGFVTESLEHQERPQHLIGCGPEPMLKALAALAQRWGVGICFSCVTKVRTADGWDYRRVCVDGPVFDAACLA